MEKKWETEDNQLDWESKGYKCAMRRNHWKTWCGYVGIPKSHPLYELDKHTPSELLEARFKARTEDEPGGECPPLMEGMLMMAMYGELRPTAAFSLNVHGGVTFSDSQIDEVPLDDEETWWFGFDCGHGGDYSPGLQEEKERFKDDAELRQMMDAVAELFNRIAPQTNIEANTVDNFMSGASLIYRDQEYVKAEVEKLATQLKEIEDWVKLEKQMMAQEKE